MRVGLIILLLIVNSVHASTVIRSINIEGNTDATGGYDDQWETDSKSFVISDPISNSQSILAIAGPGSTSADASLQLGNGIFLNASAGSYFQDPPFSGFDGLAKVNIDIVFQVFQTPVSLSYTSSSLEGLRYPKYTITNLATGNTLIENQYDIDSNGYPLPSLTNFILPSGIYQFSAVVDNGMPVQIGPFLESSNHSVALSIVPEVPSTVLLLIASVALFSRYVFARKNGFKRKRPKYAGKGWLLRNAPHLHRFLEATNSCRWSRKRRGQENTANPVCMVGNGKNYASWTAGGE